MVIKVLNTIEDDLHSCPFLSVELVISCSQTAKVLDCNIIFSDFKFHSLYYVDFRTNTLGKGLNTLIPTQL